jgi:hypothetical protein
LTSIDANSSFDPTQVTELGRVIHAYPSFAFALQQICAEIAVEASFKGVTGKLIQWFKKV